MYKIQNMVPSTWYGTGIIFNTGKWSKGERRKKRQIILAIYLNYLYIIL